MRSSLVLAALIAFASHASAGGSWGAGLNGYMDGLNGTTTPPPERLAYWTGQSRQVYLVGDGTGWNCEYDYAGQRFWRAFRTVCPSSVSID